MMDDREMSQLAEFCKMFTNPNRLAILYELSDGRQNVGELSTRTGLSQPVVSQHLRKLRNKGVVTNRKQGVNTYYRLHDERVIEVLDAIWEIVDVRARPLPTPDVDGEPSRRTPAADGPEAPED